MNSELPANIKASAHIFLVRNVRDSATYYNKALGFDRLEYYGDDFCMTWKENYCIMLSQWKNHDEIKPISMINSAIWDAYFWVDNVDHLFRQFENNGAIIFYNPFDKDYGMREGVVKDPDGYQLAFGQSIT